MQSNKLSVDYLFNISISNFQACQRTCLQKAIIDECDCADAYYPSSGKAFSKSVPTCSNRNITQGIVC